MEKLKVEYLKTNELKPYENNAKIHTDEQIEHICNSIQSFGFADPIGITGNDNTIVEGHGRLLAAQKLGMDTVPVIRLDHLTEEQRKMYTLVHNQTTMSTDFDVGLLDEELTLLADDFDVGDFGFELSLGTNDDFFIEPMDDGEEQERTSLLDDVGLDLASITYIFTKEKAEKMKELLKDRTIEEKGELIYSLVKERCAI